MYWFDSIATRNFPYVIRHQNAACKANKFGFYIFQENQDSFTLSILGFRHKYSLTLYAVTIEF